MALPLVAGAAVAAFSYWSLKTGHPGPVPMPEDGRGTAAEYPATASHAGALLPREPSAPLDVPAPVIGDRIPDPHFDAVASAQVSAFPRFQRRVEIGKAADSTEAVAGAFLSGRSKEGLPASIIVKAPGATRKSAFDSADAKEAAAIMMRAPARSSRSSHHSKTTTATTTKTTTKKGKEGSGSHWIEVALLVVAAAILLSRPRTVKKIKRVYNFATEEDTERAKQARADAARKRSRARRSRKAGAGKSGSGQDHVEETVVISGQQASDKGAAGNDYDDAGGYEDEGGYGDAGAGSSDLVVLRDTVHMWESRYASDTDSLRRQLQRMMAQLEQAQSEAERWQRVADVAADAAEEEEDDGVDEADAAELRARVRRLQRLVLMLRQQVMFVQSPARAGLGDSRLHSLDQKQLRRKMDETMALIKGEVITLDWPGIELVSRLVSEMGGGWQLHGDANKLKEDTFRECHRLLHLMVEDLEGDQEEGEPWVIDDMDAFLDKIEKDRYPDVFLTLQRLVVAYDTMGPTAKDDVSAREMVVNAGTLLEVARFTKYWVTRIHQHRTHYSSRFGAASGTMMAGSYMSGSSDEAGRDAALQRLSAVVDASHRQSGVQDLTEVTESNETQDDGHGGVVTSHTVVTRHVQASNASLESGSSSFAQISSSDARGVSASGHSLQHPPVPDSPGPDDA